MKKVVLNILLCLSIMMIVSSFGVGFAFLLNNKKPYIEGNSVVYYLNENSTIESVEITIINPSLKSVDAQDLILRYCREDRYPEGYSSPVIFSLKPLERKTVTISTFRNTWIYNESYHIEADRIDLQNNLPINIKSYTPYREIGVIALAIFPLSTIFFLISLYKVSDLKKANE